MKERRNPSQACTSLYTASTPVTMTGLLGDETWGMGRREASLETGKHGLPISTYQETQPWRLKEHLGNAPKGPLPSQICSPPWPNPLWTPSWSKGTSEKPAGFPSLPCIQGEGGTVRTGKFFVTLSRDAF